MVKHGVHELHQKTNRRIHPQRIEKHAIDAIVPAHSTSITQPKTDRIWRFGQHDASSEYGVGIKARPTGIGRGADLFT